MNPQGKVDRQSKPVPVRLFETRLEKLELAQSQSEDEIVQSAIKKLQEDIKKLPENNVVILEAKSKIDKLTDTFWQKLDEEKKEYLRREIAPLMRTRTGEDYKAMSFEIKVIQYSIAKMQDDKKNEKRASTIEAAIVEMVEDLPLSVNIVSVKLQLIGEITNCNYLGKADDKDLEVVITNIAPLMKYREEGIKPDQDSFDLRDITVQKEYIEFGPANERVTIQKYKEKVEGLVKKLEEENEILRKIKNGESITGEEVTELADTLADYEPYPTEENLQKAYDARQVHFVDLIRYIMGLGGLMTFSDKVSEAFAEFIAEHNTLTVKQIQFIHTLQTFILETGKLTKKDLVREPFTKLHARGFLGLFNKQMQEEILNFTDKLLNYA